MSRQDRFGWWAAQRRRRGKRLGKPSAHSSPYPRRLGVEQLEDRRLLAITVDTLVDEADGSIVDGDISLRDAIAAATSGETIDFAVTGTIPMNDALGEMLINKSLTIDGPGSPGAPGLTIDAGHGPNDIPGDGDGYRIFRIDDGNSGNEIDVELSGLTLTGGDVLGSGGAIENRENLGVTNSTISGNSADSRGGGIYNDGSTTVTNSTISGNSADNRGGGISSSGSTTVTNSTINGNSATSGGGIYNGGSGTTTTVTNSTISGNSVDSRGGGIYNNAGGVVTVTGSTITGNTATLSNGGIYNDATVNLTSSILAGNMAASAANFDGSAGFGTFNLIDVDPLLGPLADNGGPTWTHALLPGSPALDAGSSSEGTDQRGLARTIDLPGVPNGSGNASDIGAYEAQVAPSADFDANFLVSGAEFLTWQRGFGTTVGAARADGNSDDDGDVDASDLAAWESLYGQVVLVVTNLNDSGLGSLRAAIDFANSNPGADEITFDVTGTIAIDSQLPTITEELTIIGPDPGAPGLTIDAGGGSDSQIGNGDGYRIFYIDDGNLGSKIDVEISGLTLTGGDVAGNGGAIENFESLTVTNSTITGNAAGTFGGGIDNYGLLTILDSKLSENRSDSHGGAILNHFEANTTIEYSTLSGNAALGRGGAVYSFDNIDIMSSTLSGNSASRAGAIVSRVIGTIINSTISGNSASGEGGGISLMSGTLTVASSTLTKNSAGTGGGGIDNVSSDTAALNNTIVSGNNVNGSPDNLKGTGFSGNFNLIGTGDLLSGSNNILFDTVLLGPLADHGGPTLTHGLLPGSRAIDAGNSALSNDQRGLPRTVDLPISNDPGSNGSDIGAFERQHSQSLNWDGGGDGTSAFDPANWDDPAGFSPDRVPTSLDNLLLSSSLGSQTIDLGGQTLQVNRVESLAANSDDYTFTNGTLEMFHPGGNTQLTRNDVDPAPALTFDVDMLFAEGSAFPRFNILSTSSAIVVNGNMAPSPVRTDAITLELTSRNTTLASSVTLAGDISDGSGGAVLSLTAGFAPDSFNHIGVVTVTGDNTYTGQTLVNGATLVADSIADADGTSSALGAPTSVANGTIRLGASDTNQSNVQGKLRYTGMGDTTDRVIELNAPGAGGVIESSGSGALIFDSPAFSVGAGAKTLTLGGDNTDANEIQSVIPDPDDAGATQLSLEKTGGGTWIISGANTYSGPTTVSGGTLLVNNTSGSGTGSSSVTVEAGATLGGTGNIDGAVTVNDSAKVSPGESIGTLVVDSISFGGTNSKLLIEVGDSGHDQLTIEGGSTTLNGQLLIDLVGAIPDFTDSFTIVSTTGTLSVDFSNSSFGRVTTVGGEGSFLATNVLNDVVLSQFLATPLAAATSSADLIDAALAYELASDVAVEEETQFVEPLSFEALAMDRVLASRDQLPTAREVSDSDVATANPNEAAEAEPMWLAEELLERVFG